ncbi:hypothetical protein F5Y04DRAFT_283207 [Hypomontagnella monticulosa]|nr:hypothetical protein F5Y04DRAFT_283207 [Hypomontagnella monticulosa]
MVHSSIFRDDDDLDSPHENVPHLEFRESNRIGPISLPIRVDSGARFRDNPSITANVNSLANTDSILRTSDGHPDLSYCLSNHYQDGGAYAPLTMQAVTALNHYNETQYNAGISHGLIPRKGQNSDVTLGDAYDAIDSTSWAGGIQAYRATDLSPWSLATPDYRDGAMEIIHLLSDISDTDSQQAQQTDENLPSKESPTGGLKAHSNTLFGGSASKVSDDDQLMRQQYESKRTTQERIDQQDFRSPRANSLSDTSNILKSGSSPARRSSEVTGACTTPSHGESEVSSSPPNGDSDYSHGDEESIPIQRAERRRGLLYALMSMVYLIYPGAAAAGAMVDAESSSSGAAQGSSNNGEARSNQQNQTHDPKGKRPASGNGDDDGDGGDGGEDERQQPKRIKSGVDDDDGTNSAKKFACPYYQRRRHRRETTGGLPRRACYGPGFLSVHRVKEHIYRAHRLPLFCPRCDTKFDSDVSLEKHMRQNPPCDNKVKQVKEGIDSTAEKLLRSRNKEFNSKTEEEKWSHIYNVLFPADNPRDQPSPYYENHMDANFANDSPNHNSTARRYEEFLQREFFQRIYGVLENKIDEALDSAEKDVTDTLKSQLQGIFCNVQTELYQEFQTSIKTADEQDHDAPKEGNTNVPTPEKEATTSNTQPLPFSPGAWMTSELGGELAASSSMLYIPEIMQNLEFNFQPHAAGTSGDYNVSVEATLPFKVKVIYDYTPEDDDEDELTLKVGQVIDVTDEVDMNWYSGEYVDESVTKKEGIFPRNFVEVYNKPVAPPRPVRTGRGT